MSYQTQAEREYEELEAYVSAASRALAREFIPERKEQEREQLAKRIRNLITEVRMTDREISIGRQEEWRNLPVIEA